MQWPQLLEQQWQVLQVAGWQLPSLLAGWLVCLLCFAASLGGSERMAGVQAVRGLQAAVHMNCVCTHLCQ